MNSINYSALENKHIVQILDGDIDVGKNLKMPYLTTQNIYEIANKFNVEMTIKDKPSRWKLMMSLIKKDISEKNELKIISYLLSESNFYNFYENISNLSEQDFNYIYKQTVVQTLERINMILKYDKCKLISNNGYISIVSTDIVKIKNFNIKKIDNQYVIDLYNRLTKKIDNKELDSAVTEARTLLEEVMIKLLEKKGVSNTSKGNLNKLYGQVRELYSMCTDTNIDRRINTLLSGLNNIVSAISEMRNNYSDSHGVGIKRKKIKKHHALLIVNSAVTMAEFLLSVERNAEIQ